MTQLWVLIREISVLAAACLRWGEKVFPCLLTQICELRGPKDRQAKGWSCFQLCLGCLIWGVGNSRGRGPATKEGLAKAIRLSLPLVQVWLNLYLGGIRDGSGDL